MGVGPIKRDYPRRGKSYFCWVDGKCRSFRTDNLELAKERHRELVKQYNSEKIEKLKAQNSARLKFAVSEYLKNRSGVAKSTLQRDKQSLRLLHHYLGNPPIRTIKTQKLESFKPWMSSKEYTRGRVTKNYSLSGINIVIRHIRGFINTMYEWEWLDRVPKIKEYYIGDPEIIYMNEKEVETLLFHAKQNEKLKTIVPLMYFTGISKQTAIGNFEIKDGLIIYRRGKTKRKIAVEISKRLWPYLATLGEGEFKLRPYCSRYFSECFNKLAQTANLPWVTPHVVRHSFATILLKKGVKIEVVSLLLGHSTITVTLKHYAHLVRELKKKAVNLL